MAIIGNILYFQTNPFVAMVRSPTGTPTESPTGACPSSAGDYFGQGEALGSRGVVQSLGAMVGTHTHIHTYIYNMCVYYIYIYNYIYIHCIYVCVCERM